MRLFYNSKFCSFSFSFLMLLAFTFEKKKKNLIFIFFFLFFLFCIFVFFIFFSFFFCMFLVCFIFYFILFFFILSNKKKKKPISKNEKKENVYLIYWYLNPLHNDMKTLQITRIQSQLCLFGKKKKKQIQIHPSQSIRVLIKFLLHDWDSVFCIGFFEWCFKIECSRIVWRKSNFAWCNFIGLWFFHELARYYWSSKTICKN